MLLEPGDGLRDLLARGPCGLIGAGLVVGPLWTGCSDQPAEVRGTTGPGSARGLNQLKTRQLGTPAQIALAWLMAKKPFIVSIPGTRNIDHLRENLGALDVQLTAADLRSLDADFSKLTVHGGRMNEMQMRAVERAG